MTVTPAPIGVSDAGTHRRQLADRLVPRAGEQLEELVVEAVLDDQRARRIRDRRTDHQPRALRLGKAVPPGGRGGMSCPLVLAEQAGPGGGPSRLDKANALGSGSLDEDTRGVSLVDVGRLIQRQRAGARDEAIDQCACRTVLPHTGTNVPCATAFAHWRV